MSKEHQYKLTTIWTGNKGEGTKDYKAYDRDFEVNIEHKPVLNGSADAPFRGDITKHNPEDLLLAALSSCHMLWFLHLCADNKIIVVNYFDNAEGKMIENVGGGGKFIEVTLHPKIIITEESQIELANSLHELANKKCFIANSCNFPVHHQPTCEVIKS